ncbi:MAG: hypothetical protein V4672_16535 [Verrucomicrobiota bacterium]
MSLFTTPAPAPAYAPPPEPEPPAPPSYGQPPSGLGSGLVMPMPNSIAQHLSPMGGPTGSPLGGPPSPPPLGGFPGFPPQPQAGSFPTQPQAGAIPSFPTGGGFPPPSQPGGFPPAPQAGGFLGGLPSAPEQHTPPPWQQPGLGQTLMGGISQPASGLPPRRPEGQAPLTGSLQQPPAAWGAPPAQQPPQDFGQPQAGASLFPAPRSAGAPSHSSLIPGSPTLPVMGSPTGTDSPPSSLLSREIPAHAPAPIAVAESPREAPAAPVRPARPLKKPSRSSNVFMFALAVIFLAGFLAAAGWMFREPIMEIVHRYMPPKDEAETPPSIVLPTPNPTPEAPAIAETSPAPAPVEEPAAPTLSPKPVFDPSEPAPPRAMLPTPADMAALQPTAPGLPPEAPALTEVPSKTLTPSLQNDSNPANTTSSVIPTATAEVQVKTTEEAKPAAEALLKFLNAKDMKERMRYTLAASSMKPLMEMYYKAQPDGPVRVDGITLRRLDPKPQMGSGAHALFSVENRAWEYDVTVMLEETKDGFQVDWLSFVEFKDRLLEKFFEGYQEGAARFHVGITRVHDFEYKLPNSENKDAFRISPSPPNPYLNTVFVEKDSQIGRELKDRIPWGVHVWAIVELEWVKLGSQQWVQLVGVPQLNWYSVPAEPKAKPAKNSTDLPNEIQRAVPVGR